MKIRYLIIMILVCLFLNISKVSAEAMNLCTYEGGSATLISAIPGIPPTVLPWPSGAKIRIQADPSISDFKIKASFEHFDFKFPFTIIQIGEILKGITEPYLGTIISDSLVSKIDGNFMRVYDDNGDIAVEPYPSLQIHNSLSEQGICPKSIKVVAKSSLGGDYHIEVLSFDKTSINLNDLYSSPIIESILSFGYDSVTLVANLTDSKFGNNQFNSSGCYSSSEEATLNKEFNTIVKYQSNPYLMKMYKNNGYAGFANNVVNNYKDGGQCSASFSGFRDSAIEALKVLNSSQDPNAGDYDNDCDYILGDPKRPGTPAYYVDLVFRFIKFIAPLIVIGLTIFDYIKAIASSDGDLITKTNKKTIKRLIFALLLFVTPIIISYILTLIGVQGSCGFNNIPGV